MCYRPVVVNGVKYPCGTCAECRKYKSYLHGFAFEMIAQFFSQCSFITFTYDDEHIPLRQVSIYRDLQTSQRLGKFTFATSFKGSSVLYGRDLLDTPFSPFVYTSNGVVRDFPCKVLYENPRYSRFHSEDFNMDESYFYRLADNFDSRCSSRLDQYEFIGTYAIPVALTRDLQLLVKSMRERVRNRLSSSSFNSSLGINLPPFVYKFCAEYGPNKGRPHFHMVIAYSDKIVGEELSTMLNDWRDRHGFVLRKDANNFDKGAYGAFASYTTKYACKNDFDKHFVQLAHLVPPTRIVSSVSFSKVVNACVKNMIISQMPREHQLMLRDNPSMYLYDDTYFEFFRSFFNCKFVRSSGRSCLIPYHFRLKAFQILKYVKHFYYDGDFKKTVKTYRARVVQTPLSSLVSLIQERGSYNDLYCKYRESKYFEGKDSLASFEAFLFSQPKASVITSIYDEDYYIGKARSELIKAVF